MIGKWRDAGCRHSVSYLYCNVHGSTVSVVRAILLCFLKIREGVTLLEYVCLLACLKKRPRKWRNHSWQNRLSPIPSSACWTLNLEQSLNCSWLSAAGQTQSYYVYSTSTVLSCQYIWLESKDTMSRSSDARERKTYPLKFGKTFDKKSDVSYNTLKRKSSWLLIQLYPEVKSVLELCYVRVILWSWMH